jgi:hypothetical protein
MDICNIWIQLIFSGHHRTSRTYTWVTTMSDIACMVRIIRSTKWNRCCLSVGQIDLHIYIHAMVGGGGVTDALGDGWEEPGPLKERSSCQRWGGGFHAGDEGVGDEGGYLEMRGCVRATTIAEREGDDFCYAPMSRGDQIEKVRLA